MTWKNYSQELIVLVATTGCVIAVLLVMATDPSLDELIKGSVAGGAANVLAPFIRRLLKQE